MTERPSVGFIGVKQHGLADGGLRNCAAALRCWSTIPAARSPTTSSSRSAAARTACVRLAQTSDVVITMLPTSAIVAAVLGNGDDNVFTGMKPGTVVIEMSSGIPSITQELAEKVASLGGHMIDAPVSGGVPRAKTGELAIMAGGDPKIIDRVMPVLSTMGANVLRTGAIGSGQAMKALNTLVSAGGFLIGIEALLIGQRFGLDPGVMTDVLNAATGMNNSTQKKFKQ